MPIATLEQTKNVGITWSATFDLASYAPKVNIVRVEVFSDNEDDAFNIIELIRLRADAKICADRVRFGYSTTTGTIGAIASYTKPLIVDAEREKFQVRIAAGSTSRNLRVQITFAW